MAGGPADGGEMNGFGEGMRARARKRNVRAAKVSAGLVGVAFVCLVLVVTGFAERRRVPGNQGPGARAHDDRHRCADHHDQHVDHDDDGAADDDHDVHHDERRPRSRRRRRLRPDHETYDDHDGRACSGERDGRVTTELLHRHRAPEHRRVPRATRSMRLANPGDTYEFTATLGGTESTCRSGRERTRRPECEASTSHLRRNAG